MQFEFHSGKFNAIKQRNTDTFDVLIKGISYGIIENEHFYASDEETGFSARDLIDISNLIGSINNENK